MTTDAQLKPTPTFLSRISRRWLEQNRAYGDAWTRYAHPTEKATRPASQRHDVKTSTRS